MIGIFLIFCYIIYANMPEKVSPPPSPVHQQQMSVYVISEMRPIPEVAIDLIKKYEGFVPTPYQDEGGDWLIGYGHKTHACRTKQVSELEAERMIREDLQELAPVLLKNVKFPMNNNQYAALLSFAYNVGIGNFLKSDLLKVIHEKQAASIVAEFLRWDSDHKGNKLPGLVSRRREEASLYLTS